MQHHRYAAPRQLPRRFRAREAAADDMNRLERLRHRLKLGVARSRHNVGNYRQTRGVSRQLAANWPSAIAGTSRSSATRLNVAAMSVDAETVRRVAHLARVAVAEEEVEHLRGELNAMLAFVERLAEADVADVEPMTSVMPMAMKMRNDQVTDGGIVDDVMANAPAREDHFFVVPKVVE